MFADGYFLFSFPELVGTIVTIVGIWLVVKQLHETRLASQMEGMLSLSDKLVENRKEWFLLLDLANQEDWNTLSDKEAYDRIYASESLRVAWASLVSFYELLGVLVRRKTLDKGLANDYQGDVVTFWWKRFEKVVRQEEIESKINDVGEHWEWLAKEFEETA